MKRKYSVRTSYRYRRELKKAISRGYDKFKMITVVNLLATGDPLPKNYDDHALHGNWKGYRECHVDPDWLLVYRIYQDELILLLTSTGTHSDIF